MNHSTDLQFSESGPPGYLTTTDVRIERWFRQASRLHRNMYEGEMGEREVAVAQDQVRRLVRRLAALVV